MAKDVEVKKKDMKTVYMSKTGRKVSVHSLVADKLIEKNAAQFNPPEESENFFEGTGKKKGKKSAE
jgi:hypothetical protein